MQPKTPTTLGKLRIGDRFYYGQTKDVYEVIRHEGVFTIINKPPPLSLRYPTSKSKETPVVFLRHKTTIQ